MGRSRKKKKSSRPLMFAVVLLWLALVLLIQNLLGGGSRRGVTSSLSGVFQDGSSLEVHYLDVGQGDSTLIVCDGHAMLIDAGDNSLGTQIQMYLQKQGVTSLDYVIGTHPDADHIGGLDVILYKFDCDKVIMPDYEKDTATFRDVQMAMRQKGYKQTLPEVGEEFILGGAVFTILAPNQIYENSANDNSVAIMLRHGENRFLFTGDAEEDSENDMLENEFSLSADVYKASHHGSKTANTEAFMEAVSPTYAVISCGADNRYGHPHAEVMNRFREMGIQVFRTDTQGTIVASSDGKNIRFNVPPDEDWMAGEPHN